MKDCRNIGQKGRSLCSEASSFGGVNVPSTALGGLKITLGNNKKNYLDNRPSRVIR